ncbi:MAG: cation:proton antiporter [Blastocatellia bacterium]
MPHLLQLILLLVIIIVAAKAAGAISVRFGQPSVFGEILMGLILGPSVLNLLHYWPFSGAEGTLHATLKDFSELGVILLMFVAGLETDLREMKRVGKVAFWSALGGVITPLVAGAAVGRLFDFEWREAIFIGTVLTATSVSISAQTLMELRQLKSKEGSTLLGAAVIDDVLGIIVLSCVIAFASIGGGGGGDGGGSELSQSLPVLLSTSIFGGNKAAEISLLIALMGAFFAGGVWFAARYFEPILGFARGLPASQALLAATVALVLLYSFAAQFVGQVAAITGSYLAGVFVARTSLRKEIHEGMEPLTYSILVPVFFISIGLEADGRAILANPSQLGLMGLVLLVAVASKVVGCSIPAKVCGFTRAESLRVGIGMISRGEVGLIVAGVGLASGVIDQEIFSIMVIMVLFTTMITPLLLHWVFPKGTDHAAVE